MEVEDSAMMVPEVVLLMVGDVVMVGYIAVAISIVVGSGFAIEYVQNVVQGKRRDKGMNSTTTWYLVRL